MTSQHPSRNSQAPEGRMDLARALAERIVGQEAAIQAIVPYVEMYRAGLAPEGRPVGVFLLLGPTGTGKTKTVEALAEAIHGSEKSLVRIDCGEFQLEHEVAKLIGAPPGYLGHRETQPILTAQKLASATSERSGLSLVLFDEIEKAAPSLTRLLLGVLDKATLRLGDNSTVSFENSMIFLTSNLGAAEMMKEVQPGFGFRPAAADPEELAGRIERIGMHAIRKRFAPEFVNRIDRVIPYQPLGERELEEILELQLQALAAHIHRKLGQKSFHLAVSPEGRRFLLVKGASAESGARELNRTIHRSLLQPLASLVVRGEAPPGARLVAHPAPGGERLEIRPLSETKTPVLVIAEGNAALARLLDIQLGKAGFAIHWAGSEAEAIENLRQRRLGAVIIDQRADQPAPWELGLRLRKADRALPIVLLPATPPGDAQEAWCAAQGFAVVSKPFLMSELASEIRRAMECAEARQTPLGMAS